MISNKCEKCHKSIEYDHQATKVHIRVSQYEREWWLCTDCAYKVREWAETFLAGVVSSGGFTLASNSVSGYVDTTITIEAESGPAAVAEAVERMFGKGIVVESVGEAMFGLAGYTKPAGDA